MRPLSSLDQRRTWAGVLLVLSSVAAPPPASADDRFFESKIRPLLAENCFSCHGPQESESGLRLDSEMGLSKGGDSGAAVVAGKPEASLLIAAVEQRGDLKMPPDGKLSPTEISHLRRWIADGAKWPEAAPTITPVRPQFATIAPNDASIASSLQLWLRADTLALQNGEAVHVWPDQSGKGRDLGPTRGIRQNGVGRPPAYVKQSKVAGSPAVRFADDSGLGSSPDNPLAIQGDGEATIFIVCRMEPSTSNPPYGNLLMIGDPAAPSNPGKALAFYLELDRSQEPKLDFAGGWNHDTSAGPGSLALLYESPRLLTVTKTPGPMTKTTRIYFESRPSSQLLGHSLTGVDSVPAVRHRSDVGVAIGKALNWSGSIRGDIAELIVYNRRLDDDQRRGVEAYLMGKYQMLTDETVALAARDFSEGQRSHWSFQPLKEVRPPINLSDGWSTSPIDRFIYSKLVARGLMPAGGADRRALIRRATFDLTGLPPAPEEIDAFVADERDDAAAFAQVVDRLLDSPHYGERWGRHWLDAVRYADTTANDGNFVMRYAYRYRDYVVRSFNNDKPYYEFVAEQIAGDLMPASDPAEALERTIATGFLMIGPKALAEADKEQTKMDIVDEQLDVVGRAMLGLTIACARCHDHKFDPIPTVDYYSLAGILRSTEMFADLNRGASKWLEYGVPTGKGGETIPVMAPKEGPPRNLQVHLRGSRFRLGQVAPRRFLQIIAGSGHTPLPAGKSGRLELAKWVGSPSHPLASRVMVNRIWQGHFGVGLVPTSDDFGTRGEPPTHPDLLDWLTKHFIDSGGSVKAMHRLILNSSTYRMSAATTAEKEKLAVAADPDNRLLWRARRRRLDAEQLRDSLLLIAGRLDRTVGGGELIDALYEAGQAIDAKRGISSASTINSRWSGFDSTRRSLYLPVVRNGLPDVLAIFDPADPNSVTTRRNETTVPAQAAFLLNSPFATQQAAAFADRVMKDANGRDERIRRAYLIALGREPDAEERIAGRSFVADYAVGLRNAGKSKDVERDAWSRYCQLLFCLNEFLYVE